MAAILDHTLLRTNLQNLGQEAVSGNMGTITCEAEVLDEVEANIEVETMEGSRTAGDV